LEIVVPSNVKRTLQKKAFSETKKAVPHKRLFLILFSEVFKRQFVIFGLK